MSLQTELQCSVHHDSCSAIWDGGQLRTQILKCISCARGRMQSVNENKFMRAANDAPAYSHGFLQRKFPAKKSVSLAGIKPIATEPRTNKKLLLRMLRGIVRNIANG